MEIKSIKWYEIKKEVWIAQERGLLNGPTRLAYTELQLMIKSPVVVEEINKFEKKKKKQEKNFEERKFMQKVNEIRASGK